MINKIQALWARLNKFEKIDPDNARRGRLLNILLVGAAALSALALMLVLAIISATSSDDPGNGALILTLSVFVAGSLALLVVNQISVKSASTLFLALITLMFTFSDTPAELSNGRSSYVFFIPIAISSLLLAPASSFFFALAGGAIIVVLADIGNQVPNVATIISGFMLALVSWLSSRSLERALKYLRVINLNLDKLVEQKTEELSLALSREIVLAGRNQAILDSIADGVIVFDEKQVSILANPALSQLTETPIDNFTKINLPDFVKSEELSSESQEMILDLIDHPKKTATGVRVEWGKKTLSVNAARVRDSETNENIGAVAVFRDVTREAELEKMKGNFVAVVSHELRTPLNAILGYTEMLREAVYGPINEKQTTLTERITVNAQRLFTMVNDLIDEAQLKSGKLSIVNQPFQLSSLLDTMHATMDKIAYDKGLYLTDEVDPNLPETILGDAQRLQQIIVNLVNNSAKFTENGGVHVRFLRDDSSYWKIEIIDTGIGIPEKELPYIFETFRQVENASTRKHKGFGLGLAIVKQLIELMKGEISVTSELNKGSVFTVTLPL